MINACSRGAQDAAARLMQTADLLACRIRRECRLLSEREKQQKGRELLGTVPASLRRAVVERLKARSSA